MAALAALGLKNSVRVFDISSQTGQAFAKKWDLPAPAQSIHELLSQPTQLVIVTSPPDERMALLREIILHKPLKALVIEKPIVRSAAEIDTIKEILSRPDVGCWVPYIRTWVKGLNKWKHVIARGELGEFVGGFATYGKGLRNNGSHLLAMLFNLVGYPVSAQTGGKIADSREDDPTFHLRLSYPKNTMISVLGLDHRNFSHLSATLYFTSGRLDIDQGGRQISWSQASPDKIYPGYQSLSTPTVEDSAFDDHFINFYADVLTGLTTDETSGGNLDAVIRLTQFCDRLVEGQTTRGQHE